MNEYQLEIQCLGGDTAEEAQRWPDTHPAKWSREILAAIAPTLKAWRLPVHDPFAGTGQRLGELCDALELPFTGTEIEPEFARDQRVTPGDSTDAATYPTGAYCVVTSPAYPNGMADHFKATSLDRNTYRQALAKRLGHDRPLHTNNMGRYGLRYGDRQLARHYSIARQCVRWWPDRAIVNIKDFFYKRTEIHPTVARWQQILTDHDYLIVDEIPVKTPGQKKGANRDLRVDHEMVLVASRV